LRQCFARCSLRSLSERWRRCRRHRLRVRIRRQCLAGRLSGGLRRGLVLLLLSTAPGKSRSPSLRRPTRSAEFGACVVLVRATAGGVFAPSSGARERGDFPPWCGDPRSPRVLRTGSCKPRTSCSFNPRPTATGSWTADSTGSWTAGSTGSWTAGSTGSTRGNSRYISRLYLEEAVHHLLMRARNSPRFGLR
jgi:hypothetical protein